MSENTIPPKGETPSKDAQEGDAHQVPSADSPEIEDDGDRTLLFTPEQMAEAAGATSEPEAPPFDDDGDRTVLFSPEEVAEAQAAADTQESAGAAPEAEADDADDGDRTVLFTPEQVAEAQAASAPVGDDDGFGISGTPLVAPVPAPHTPPPAGEDDDRTIVATTPPASAPPPVPEDDDRTVIANTTPVRDPSSATNAPTYTATPNVVPPAPGAPITPLSSLQPGTVINNMYRVEESLDQGGMGCVFRGSEIGTGEAVAIKVILPEMAEDDKVTQMFRREARTLRQLHHDAIVRYFAYVPPDQNMNLHALVMGFIQGTKLSDTLAENGPLTSRQVVKLTMRLADGLERAHQKGVVHRDLSPDNVMLENGDIMKAVLIDFGISRSSTVKDVTIGNEFAGKLKYVSPEQLGSYGGQAEGQSDVYSLGLLMIAMLQGKPLQMGSSFADAVLKRQSVPDLTGLPFEFHDILTKMLQPDPADRMPSMAAVIEDLSELDGGSTGMTRNRGTRPPVADRAVPGLQAVPMAAHSAVTSAPSSDTQKSFAEASKKKSGLGFFLSLGVVAAAAVGAYVMFGDQLPLPGQGEDAAQGTTDAVAEGLQRIEGARATYLATAVPQACAYAPRRNNGASAGVIEGFGTDAAALRGLGAGFGTEYGITPEVVTRTVQEVHCPVLDFARTFQGTKGASIEMTLAANVSPRSEGVVGTIHGSDGRQNFLALVDRAGRMYSLMRQLDDPIGDERRFAFRLPSAEPGIYMLIATASDSPLVRAGAMQDGMMASEFLPLLTRELAVDGQGAVDISYLELTR